MNNSQCLTNGICHLHISSPSAVFCELLSLPPFCSHLAIYIPLSCVKKFALPQMHCFGSFV